MLKVANTGSNLYNMRVSLIHEIRTHWESRAVTSWTVQMRRSAISYAFKICYLYGEHRLISSQDAIVKWLATSTARNDKMFSNAQYQESNP
jgi:hypothetical protein